MKLIIAQILLNKKQADVTFIDDAGMWRQVGIDVILKLFDEMFEQGFQPNSKSYSFFVETLCKAHCMEEAKAFALPHARSLKTSQH